MQQIFIEQSIEVGQQFELQGDDVKHIVSVLRMKPGEILRVSCENQRNFLCELLICQKDMVKLEVTEEVPSTELPQKIYLFQAIPKGDRMETVVEKAVELGAYEIIPVEMKYCVVKLDEKKKANRCKRYQSIAESAAKQSKRSRIPQVHSVMTYKEAVDYANANCDLKLVPYECKDGMDATKTALAKIKDSSSIAIFIGPEGGFASEEIEMVQDTMEILSLGKRILRTDTAAITSMSMVMLACEC